MIAYCAVIAIFALNLLVNLLGVVLCASSGSIWLAIFWTLSFVCWGCLLAHMLLGMFKMKERDKC